MFAVRGIAVTLSVFVIVYGALSLAVSLGWRWSGSKVRRHGQRHPARRSADLLFAWRMSPLLTAAVITGALTVPSFLLLEPRAIDEPLGGIPLALGICAVGLGIFGVLNAGLALRRVSRVVARWTRAAQPVETCAPVPVLRISAGVPAMNRPAMNRPGMSQPATVLPALALPALALPALALPAMTVAGIVRPRVLLSSAAESVLTAAELQMALNHEIAHVRRRDNLKKLMLRCVAFPGMAGLEAAWLEATEMAADDAAVSNAGEALDLAAALIKLSRLEPVEWGSVHAAIDLTATLVHGSATVMSARVERLIAWRGGRLAPPRTFSLSPWYGVGAAVATVAVFAATYSQLLVRVHTATEWLVR
jgi:Zn-dependent protease with chaperone function